MFKSFTVVLTLCLISGAHAAPWSTKMEFVSIPAGTFMMGSRPDDEAQFEDEIYHSVTISKGFEMQTTDVTQAQWVELMGKNPALFQDERDCPHTFGQVGAISLCPENPIEMVSWEEAQEFIAKLNQKNDGYHYRLPTEAEWEYAARAGTTTIYTFGDTDAQASEYAWNFANSDHHTHEVGQLKPNLWGLYDMQGNVNQWVADWYGSYKNLPPVDPQGPAQGKFRVYRGGSFVDRDVFLRPAHRMNDYPVDHDPHTGFRLVRVK